MKIRKKMKRLVAVVIVFVLSVNLCGCNLLSKRKSDPVKQAEVKEEQLKNTVIEKSELEKSALRFQEKAGELEEHFKKGNTAETQKVAGQLIKVLKDSKGTIAKYYKEVENTILSLKSDKLLQRQKKYEKKYNDNIQETEILLNQIVRAENENIIKEAVEELSMLMEDDEAAVYSITPKNLEIEKEVSFKEIGDINTYEAEMQKQTDALAEEAKEENLLKFSNETTVTDAIREKAEELKTPLNVYNYLKNTLDYEWYSGSRKGAGQTLDTMSGNDKDQASLLIAMLCILGYKARYVDGTILLKEKQLKNLTGAKDVYSGANVLASAGIPVNILTTGGKPVAVSFAHTWVETYVPYSDYRGAGNSTGDYIWIALDTGIQEYKNVDTVYSYCEEEHMTADWKEVLKKGSVSDVEAVVQQIDQKLSDSKQRENLYIQSRVKKEKKVSYLPLSLQYQVLKRESCYASIAEKDTDHVEFLIAGKNLTTCRSYDLTGKRITISYEPETKQDEQVIDQYGSVFRVPAYLVKMCPILKIDGKEVARGKAVVLGESQNFTMRLFSSGQYSEVSNDIFSGSIYQVTFDAQSISAEELDSSYSKYKELKASATAANVYSENYLGKVLNVAGKLYFAQLDIANRMLGEQYQVKATRSLSVGMTGYQARTSRLYGTPVGLDEGSLYIDVDHDAHSVVSLNGDHDTEKQFMRASGMMSSLYESTIWEELTGAESISTISVLNKAQQEGIHIYALNKKNYQEALEKLEVEDAVLQDVKKAVCNGKEVTIPAKEITIGSWSGSGYIVTDPDTGAAGYMISGGLNGGSVSGIVTIEAILGLILAALSIAELVTGIIGLLMVLASLSIVGWIVLIVEICFLLSIIKYMSDLLYDYYEYVDGNQQLGDNIVKETETFAAMTLLCASILKILKLYGIDVTKWLSSKIMKSKPGEGAGTIGEGKGENAGKNEETGKRDEAGNG